MATAASAVPQRRSRAAPEGNRETSIGVSTKNMRRLGFRRFLPLLFSAVHLTMIWSTLAQQDPRWIHSSWYGMPHVSPPLRDMGTTSAVISYGGEPRLAKNPGAQTDCGRARLSAVPKAPRLARAPAPAALPSVEMPVAWKFHQEVGGIATAPIYEPPALTPAQKTAILLNLPATHRIVDRPCVLKNSHVESMVHALYVWS